MVSFLKKTLALLLALACLLGCAFAEGATYPTEPIAQRWRAYNPALHYFYWQLTDDDVGTVVLEAAGYTLALYSEPTGYSATVDGIDIAMKEDDFDFESEGHFINAEFLADALKGEAIWDQEENTLILRIRDKEAAEAND